jgi:hypothetical protein
MFTGCVDRLHRCCDEEHEIEYFFECVCGENVRLQGIRVLMFASAMLDMDGIDTQLDSYEMDWERDTVDTLSIDPTLILAADVVRSLSALI